MFSSLSIKKKLVFIILSSIGIAITLSATIIMYTDIKNQEANLFDRIEAHARIAAVNTSAALLFDDSISANEVLHSLSLEHSIVRAIIYDSSNNIFASYKRNRTYQNGRNNVDSSEKSNIIISAPISYNNKDIGTITIYASKKVLFESLIEHIVVVMLVSLLIGILTYLWSIKLQYYISKPINNMLSITRQVKSSNDYSIRLQKFYDDELGMLANDFNSMLSQIEQRDKDLENKVHERTKLLYDTQKRFRSTFSNAAVGMLLHDECGRIFQVNRAACKMLGINEKKLISMTVNELTHPEDFETNYREFKKNNIFRG